MPTETVVYIHGVQSDLHGSSHGDTYDKLHQGIGRHKPPGWPKEPCRVEWGWNARGADAPAGHELLTDAQRELGGRTLGVVDATGDFTLDPTRLVVNQFRPLMMHGFADMFYYVSSDGKSSVRYAVAEQIVKHLHAQIEGGDRISLTLVGHSAGSVIAFDLLFYLFYPWSKPADHSARPSSDAAHVFIETDKVDEKIKPRTITDLRRLRQLAQEGRLRVRRLFTMGSPLAMLAYRSNALLKILADRAGRIDASLHGLTCIEFFYFRLPFKFDTVLDGCVACTSG